MLKPVVDLLQHSENVGRELRQRLGQKF